VVGVVAVKTAIAGTLITIAIENLGVRSGGVDNVKAGRKFSAMELRRDHDDLAL
jgi:hypothetical protein